MKSLGKAAASVAGALVLSASLVGSAGADTRTATNRRFYVTQKHTLNLDFSTCDGAQLVRFNSVSVKYTRSVSNRRVSESHLRTVEKGNRCSGEHVNLSRFGDVHPVFGCGGRCGANETNSAGHYLGWPYVLNNGESPVVTIAASARGKIKSGGSLLGYICTEMRFVGNLACTSSG